MLIRFQLSFCGNFKYQRGNEKGFISLFFKKKKITLASQGILLTFFLPFLMIIVFIKISTHMKSENLQRTNLHRQIKHHQ